jgi:single-strand DNA-binding protein
VDRPFTNAAGERETDFINIVAWRQRAEFAANYLGKGRLVGIDGRLQIRQWTSQEGQRRQTAEVVADDVRGLDRRREEEAAAPTEEEPLPPEASEVGEGEQSEVPTPWEDQ